MSANDQFMNIDNARLPLQRENMRKIEAEGFCPFCPEHLKKYHEPPIIKKGAHWTVTPNMYPYENVAHQLLFITHEHITNSKDIPAAAWAELQTLVNWTINEYGIDSATLLMRSGDMNKNGSTVQHIHAQLVSGKNKDTPVVTRIA